MADDLLLPDIHSLILSLERFINCISLQHDRVSNYDRTFHVKTDYCSKLHRDDRVHTRGLNVNAEVSGSFGQLV